MTAPKSFSDAYADIYDLLHVDKPYDAEVQLVLDAAQSALGRMPRNAVDLACGTGRHLLEFARRDIYVHGNDLSAGMTTRASRRLAETNPQRFALSTAPMQTLTAAPPTAPAFDLATMFYTAMGYLVAPLELERLLGNLRKLVVPGGIVFGDLWNGHKMSREFSPRRERHVENAKLALDRISTVQHLPALNALKVDFSFTITDKETHKTDRFDESHTVRYHSPIEIENLLLAHGFEPLALKPFFDAADTPEEAWNFYFVARRDLRQ